MFIRLYEPDLYKGFHGTKTVRKLQEKNAFDFRDSAIITFL